MSRATFDPRAQRRRELSAWRRLARVDAYTAPALWYQAALVACVAGPIAWVLL